MSTKTTRGGNFGAKVIPLQRTRHTPPAKRTYMQLSDDVRARITRELFALKVAGQLDAAGYAAISGRTGASKRTLEGLVAAAVRNAAAGGEAVADPRIGHTSQLEITTEVLLCHVGRDLTSAHMRAMATGLIPACHRTTYQRALLKKISANELRGLRLGQRVLPEQWVYLDRRENPLMDQFTVDLFFPRVRTTRADGTTAIPVWVSIRERSRGLLLAWKLFQRAPRNNTDVEGDPDSGPTSADVLALIGEAIRGWTHEGVFCGGVPRALRCDREALFHTPELRVALMILGIEVDPTNSYSSWENGAHERMHEVIRTEALQGLLASNGGPQTRAKKLHFAEVTMPFAELEGRLDRWSMSYNFERANTAVGGLPPFESWRERLEAGDTVTRASNRELAALSLPAGTATKQKDGITLPGSGVTYSGPALNAVARGTQFALGKWLTDERHLEIFNPVTSEYVATLERTSDMSAETEGAIKHSRNRQRETVANILAEAHRRHRIAEGPTPPRPAAADEPTPIGAVEGAEAADGATVEDQDTETPPSSAPQGPGATPDDAADADGSDTDMPAYAVPLVNTFAARFGTAADPE